MTALDLLNLKISFRSSQELGPKTLDRPDRWYDNPKWRCENHHVSDHYIMSKNLGPYCPVCFDLVVLTFPEDQTGPIII